jgi:flagellar hook protein FlgE
MITPAFSSAVSGMADARRRFDVAAHNVANVSTDSFAPLRADGPQGEAGTLDVASELVNGTVLAPAAYTVNATVIRVADETRKSLLDILA